MRRIISLPLITACLAWGAVTDAGAATTVVDTFEGDLDASWQRFTVMDQGSKARVTFDTTTQPGTLVYAAQGGRDQAQQNVLLRKGLTLAKGHYVQASVALDLSNHDVALGLALSEQARPKERKGILRLLVDYKGRVVLGMDEQPLAKTDSKVIKPYAWTVLRLTRQADGQVQAAYSADGKRFVDLGKPVAIADDATIGFYTANARRGAQRATAGEILIAAVGDTAALPANRPPPFGLLALDGGPLWKARHDRIEPIDLADMYDSIQHSRLRFLHHKTPYEIWEPDRAAWIALNILARQRRNGGWPKNVDHQKQMTDDEVLRLWGRSRGSRGGTLDNWATFGELRYLAKVAARIPDPRLTESIRSGLGFILGQQNSRSGGWAGCDVNAVTYNDHVMSGVLVLLRDFCDGTLPDPGLGDAFRARLQAAFDRGLQCVLKSQKRIGGQLTIWGQQHAHNNIQSLVGARTFEPAALTSAESVRVVQMLMGIKDPPPEVIASIRAAVRWFATHRIVGVKQVQIKAEKVRFPYKLTDTDRVIVAAGPEEGPWWTRYYDAKEQQPLFKTRKGVEVRDFAKVSRERRDGYSWWNTRARDLLEKDYPAWRAKYDPDHDACANAGPGITYTGTILKEAPEFGTPKGWEK